LGAFTSESDVEVSLTPSEVSFIVIRSFRNIYDDEVSTSVKTPY